MLYRMPPLTALRAFEATARHLSLKQAANELCVTTGAVSQHVKALEEQLGVTLFRRCNRSLELTPAGFAYLPALRDAFRIISDATQRIALKRPFKILNLGVQASFAIKCLIPRLPAFLSENPEVDVRLGSSIELHHLREGRIDAIIRYGVGDFPGVRNILIRAASVDPVCSPNLLADGPPLRKPADLRHYMLLHDEFREGWRTWLAPQQVEDIDLTKGLSFTDEHLALQAAIEGLGVALAHDLLAERDILAGRLVYPFGAANQRCGGYYLLFVDGHANCTKLETFLGFLTCAVMTGENEPHSAAANSAIDAPRQDAARGQVKLAAAAILEGRRVVR